MWYIYNGILAIKRNEIMTFAAVQIDLEIIILSEINQIKKYIISLICEILKKMIRMNLLTR